MIRALVYREYIKTYKTLLPLAVLVCISAVMIAIVVDHDIRVSSPIEYFSIYIFGSKQYQLYYRLLPSILGLGVGLAQMLPESSNGRMRLTLHMPMSETKIIATMCIFGWCALTILWLLTMGIFMIGAWDLLPMEIMWIQYKDYLPCSFMGILAYNFGAAIGLESRAEGRVRMGICLIFSWLIFFYLPSTRDESTLMQFVVVLASCAAPFLSCKRFKGGLR